jgi:hypothetical protein
MENHARHCLRLAQFVNDSGLRDRLFEMAREWMDGAQDAGEPRSPIVICDAAQNE